MSTFQGIVFAIFFGFTSFLPVSWSAHQFALPFFIGWSEIGPKEFSALAGGGIAAILVYFRHDWASIISGFLRTVLLFQKPRTIDEKMLPLLALTTLPYILASLYLEAELPDLILHPLWIAGNLIFFSFPLLIADYLNRKSKNMLSWNAFDSILVGLFQLIHFVPGAGRVIGAFSAGLLRNYDRLSAIKYAYLSFIPILAFQIIKSRATLSETESTTLTLTTMGVVSFIATLLAVGGFMKSIDTKNWWIYVAYRMLLAGSIIGFYLYWA